MHQARIIEHKVWFSAAELAALNLPGLSHVQRLINRMADDQHWAERVNAAGDLLSRKRAGRGGGLEYHHGVLPASAALELVKRGYLHPSEVTLSDDLDADEALEPVVTGWAWFDQQSSKIKAEAERRLKVIRAVSAIEKAGLGRNSAVAQAAIDANVSAATVWNWLAMVKGVASQDHLPALAPRRKGGGQEQAIDPDLLLFFKSFYLRPSPVGFEESYRQTVKEAKKRGLVLPCTKTLTRRLRKEVPAEVIMLKRKGMEAVINMVPAQKRTRANLHALQAVNMDGHKWDVFVHAPAKDGRPARKYRPFSVVIQDLYSNKILACRTGEAETAVLTHLAIADMLKIGIPYDLTTDNGRAFASKWISGGAKTRFRFKIKEEEPLGILPQLGINIHWAKPHHGQSKPIERAFRTLEEKISMHPLCQGAYTGHHIDAKPDDYNTRTIPEDVFLSVIANGIAEYNAQGGRRGTCANGRSYDQTFQDSVNAGAPLRYATEEQRRTALLTAEQVRANRKNGMIELYGNSYYAREMMPVAGELVTVKFDPENLMNEVFVYRKTGEFLCAAPIFSAMGFYDVAAAKARAKMEKDLRKTTRLARDQQGLLSAAKLGDMIQLEDMPVTTPNSNVVRPLRMRGNAAPASAPAAMTNRQLFRESFASAMADVAEPVREKPQRFRILDGGLNPALSNNAAVEQLNAEPERPQK